MLRSTIGAAAAGRGPRVWRISLIPTAANARLASPMCTTLRVRKIPWWRRHHVRVIARLSEGERPHCYNGRDSDDRDRNEMCAQPHHAPRSSVPGNNKPPKRGNHPRVGQCWGMSPEHGVELGRPPPAVLCSISDHRGRSSNAVSMGRRACGCLASVRRPRVLRANDCGTCRSLPSWSNNEGCRDRGPQVHRGRGGRRRTSCGLRRHP